MNPNDLNPNEVDHNDINRNNQNDKYKCTVSQGRQFREQFLFQVAPEKC